MTAGLPLSITADTQMHQLVVRRGFDAPKALVWDCYTKADLLDQWFAPEPMTAKTKTMEFREGGHWHFAMVAPDGTKYWARFDYETIDPIVSYRARDTFSNPEGEVDDSLPLSIWDVTFADQAPGTLVQIVVAYDSAEAMQHLRDMGMEQGLKATLNSLDHLLNRLIHKQMQPI